MCAFKGCNFPGDMAPKLTFSFRDGRVPHEIPAVLSLAVCADCRPGLMGRSSVKEAAERILERLVTERGFDMARQEVEMQIDWLLLDSEEYKQHKGKTPS
jgi:hypothetical protein